MDNGLREAELLLKKYTKLLSELDPKHKNSQITGEAYNMIIQDAKKGIARAKSRNENSGLNIPDVRLSCFQEVFDKFNETQEESDFYAWLYSKAHKA